MLSDVSINSPDDLALMLMLLALAFGYYKGRSAPGLNGQSIFWTNVPLIALAAISLGPSSCAVILYLAYELHLLQPAAPGYKFGSTVLEMPREFALINWAFVPLYGTCRGWPTLRGARRSMWYSVIAMSVPNLMLFGLAPEMITNARGAGQGIGFVMAVLLSSPIAAIWPGIVDTISGPGTSFQLIFMALIGFLPILGLIGWSVGKVLDEATA